MMQLKIKNNEEFIPRNPIARAADYLGYIPGLGHAVGATRAVLGIAITFFAGLGYAASSGLKEAAVCITKLRGSLSQEEDQKQYKGEDFQICKDNLKRIMQRSTAEVNRGLYQEILCNTFPLGSFIVDQIHERLPAECPLSSCARASFLDINTGKYCTTQPNSTTDYSDQKACYLDNHLNFFKMMYSIKMEC